MKLPKLLLSNTKSILDKKLLFLIDLIKLFIPFLYSKNKLLYFDIFCFLDKRYDWGVKMFIGTIHSAFSFHSPSEAPSWRDEGGT